MLLQKSVAPEPTALAESQTGIGSLQCSWPVTFFVNKALLEQAASICLHMVYNWFCTAVAEISGNLTAHRA